MHSPRAGASVFQAPCLCRPPLVGYLRGFGRFFGIFVRGSPCTYGDAILISLIGIHLPPTQVSGDGYEHTIGTLGLEARSAKRAHVRAGQAEPPAGEMERVWERR